MIIQESAENYLEAILMIKQKNGEVHSVDIAAELGFSKPSVSVAMKNFRNNGYIVMDEHGHIELTSAGLEIAERIYERHRLLTDLLIKIGVSEKTAREDACRIEHDISNETFDAIKKLYNGSLNKAD
ncbi:MAG: metal-dependent transcriptional regulator [Clostridia bacterium]